MQKLSNPTVPVLAILAASAAAATAQPVVPPSIPAPVLPPPIAAPSVQTEVGGPGAPPPPAPTPIPAPAPTTPRPTAVPIDPFDPDLAALSTAPYTLGAGDSVNVQIFNVPEYSGVFVVGVDGKLRVPLVGAFDVEGLTLDQLTDLLVTRFEPIVQRPIVTADLAQPRPVRVALSGEIVSPGSYTLANFPPISEVVRDAGGLTQSADVRRILLTRVVGDRILEVEVDLFALLAEGDLTRDIRLRDDDRIFIPTIDATNTEESRLLAASTVASPEVGAAEIAVIGSVGRPGTHTVQGGGPSRPPTVTSAIVAAGGITNRSDLRSIYVRRPTRTGEERIIPANLWETLVAGDLSQDVIVQRGDTIVVPEATEILPAEEEALATASFAPETITVNFVGEVNRRGAVQMPSNIPLSQAILQAGGFFRSRAKRSSVRLIRVNANGTVTEQRIKVDFTAANTLAENPTLRNNDYVIVGRNVFAQIGDTLDVVFAPFFRVLSTFDRVDDVFSD